MGFSANTYIGPYARCQNGKTTVEVTVNACGNPTCPQVAKERYEKVKFCETCGTAIGPVKVSRTQDRVPTGDLQEYVIGGKMTPINTEFGFKGWEDVDVWINNLNTIPVGKHYEPKSEIYHLENPKPEMIAEEIKQFEQLCADSLAELRKAYGPENVKISWGILGWMS